MKKFSYDDCFRIYDYKKKNCERETMERNWVCKRLIREIIIKRFFAWEDSIGKEKFCNIHLLFDIFLHFVDVHKRIPNQMRAGTVHNKWINRGLKFPRLKVSETWRRWIQLPGLPAPRLFMKIVSAVSPSFTLETRLSLDSLEKKQARDKKRVAGIE